MIRIDPPPGRPPPTITGLTVEEDVWKFDPEPYHRFIEEATDIQVPANLTATDCYRIGNRLEALIEEAHRQDRWNRRLIEQYPTVTSLDEIVGLAHVFRTCHESCVSDAKPHSG